LRQDFDRLTQPFVRFAGFRARRVRRGALAHHLADRSRDAAVLAQRYAATTRRRTPFGGAQEFAWLRSFLLFGPDERHYRPHSTSTT
jgi:hypothetical protein